MPFEKLDPQEWKRAMSRVAIIGPPNSWKTSSLLTWPRPIHIMSFPGEHGASSIPDLPDVHAYVWRDPGNLSPEAVRDQVWNTTMDILAGKHGECATFAGDGFHKCYTVFREARFSELSALYPNLDAGKLDEKIGGRSYGEAHALTYRYFRKVISSTVPNVVFTMWAAREKDNAEDTGRNAPTHIWPDLPGELAKNVMGEFAIALYAMPGQEIAPGKYREGTWQTRPGGKVWGAGTKLPLDVAKRIPTVLPYQDWGRLEALILGTPPAGQEVKK